MGDVVLKRDDRAVPPDAETGDASLRGVAAEVAPQPGLGGAQVATFCAGIREGGRSGGRAIGILAIHFDWEPQARSIVDGVRVDPADRERTRVMLVDAHGLVLASSGRRSFLQETLPFQPGGRQSGADAAGAVVAFHRTPGYETYAGLGWYGVIVQQPEEWRTLTR